MAKARGPLFLVDAAQIAGPFDIDIPGMHIDALPYIGQTGIQAMWDRETTLMHQLHEKLVSLPGTHLPGTGDWRCRAPIVSADFGERDNAIIFHRPAEVHGILSGCGLHCVPSAHRTLGAFPQGTGRFSIGYMNTEWEVDQCAGAVRELLGSS